MIINIREKLDRKLSSSNYNLFLHKLNLYLLDGRFLILKLQFLTVARKRSRGAMISNWKIHWKIKSSLLWLRSITNIKGKFDLLTRLSKGYPLHNHLYLNLPLNIPAEHFCFPLHSFSKNHVIFCGFRS